MDIHEGGIKMCNLLQEHEHEIRQFCKENDLDVENVFRFPKCGDSNTVFVQKFVKEQYNGQGLMDERPMPVVLCIYRQKDDSIRIETTEYTERYLGIRK